MTVRTNNTGPFNSRPHKEVDAEKYGVEIEEYLSIHDLTRRSTAGNVPAVAR